MVFLPNFSFDLLYYLHNYKFVYSINSCNRIVKAELEISCATPRLNWILLKRNIVKSCGYYDNMVRAFLLHRFIVATFLADTEANKKTISSFFLLILRKRSDYDHMKNIFYNKDFSRLHLTFPMTFKDIILAIIDGNN